MVTIKNNPCTIRGLTSDFNLKLITVLFFLIALGIQLKAQSKVIQTGIASYYADKFEGRLTASGERYKHSKLSAAHKTLPFGTRVRVTNLKNKKSVVVTINDRGPFVEGRVIDLSKSAAEALSFLIEGLAEVSIEVIDSKQDTKSQGNMGKPTIESAEVIDENEYYEFNVDRIRPYGFGVQVGTFREAANLVRLAENLKKSYKKRVVVHVSELNNIKVYKIIIGGEKSRKKAEKLKNRLSKRYPDSFIISFSNIR